MEKLSTSEQIKIELKRNDLTQADLANQMNLTPAAISLKLRDNIWKPAELFFIKHKIGLNIE